MAASVLCRRTLVICNTFKGISAPKTLNSASYPSGILLQTASYNPKPLKRNLRDPYIPDKSSERTPEWQKTSKYDMKLYGRYGLASGIDPASLWPSHAELDKIIAEENEWHPPLDVMLKNIAAKQKEEADKRMAKAFQRVGAAIGEDSVTPGPLRWRQVGNRGAEATGKGVVMAQVPEVAESLVMEGFVSQGEAHRRKHGQNAQDDRRLAQREARS
ncbi:uncharacterized protein gadd45gip1 isoform X2 [Vanacampus margaritifer]